MTGRTISRAAAVAASTAVAAAALTAPAAHAQADGSLGSAGLDPAGAQVDAASVEMSVGSLAQPVTDPMGSIADVWQSIDCFVTFSSEDPMEDNCWY